MNRNWKPGDVAIVEVGYHANRHVGLFCEDGWHYGTAGWVANDPAIVTARPLLVIDPEDHKQVESLYPPNWHRTAESVSWFQNHLRSLLTQPKPEEPTGLGAVVEDANGVRWLNTATDGRSSRWISNPGGYGHREYDEIDAVKILSEGVQA